MKINKKGRCEDCKYYKPDEIKSGQGHCFIWKKNVNADFSCKQFKPINEEEKEIILEEE